ncbi:glycosyltransferase [Aliidiomarina indica]|uniref:glycosyltransferase n=1 Tax=Aliidiomarina indica TaxID=2749147 RepID=UPI00188F2EBB|nr:glycosyltransferase [Aliidiomarina indica]
MKIAHIILTSSFAGSERYAVSLAHLQAQAGHEVHLILHQRGRKNRVNPIAPRVDESVHVHYVSGIPPIARWLTRKLLRQIKPDVAHGHLSNGCKALHPMQGELKRIGSLHVHYKSQQHAKLDGLIAIAPWQIPHMPDDIRKKTVHVDNWIAPFDVDPDARRRIRAEYGVGDDEILIGTVGRLEPSKDQMNLVRSFRRAEISGSRLAIVGHGSQMPALEKAGGGQVIFPGYVTNVREWMSAFDVFVSTARSEPFGLVFLEAMQIGLPIIATRTQGALHLGERQRSAGDPEFVQPLLPIGDSLALQSALIQQVKRCKQNGCPRIDYGMAKYAPAASIQAITNFYKS